MAIGIAFNFLLEHDGKGLRAFGRGWRLVFTLSISALILGGLFVMNGWDYPTYVGLTIVCIALQQWLAYEARFSASWLLDVFIASGALVALSCLLYMPFYLNFSSPSQGLGIVPATERSATSQRRTHCSRRNRPEPLARSARLGLVCVSLYSWWCSVLEMRTGGRDVRLRASREKVKTSRR